MLIGIFKEFLILSIAKEYGGGGHVCACGFVSDKRLVTPQK